MRWFLIFLLLSACHSRYIDRDAGQGPQGGPGYKPFDPSDGDNGGHSLPYTYIYPDVATDTTGAWPFTTFVNDGQYTFDSHYLADLKSGKVLDARYPNDFYLGSVRCLDSSDPCTKIEITMAATLLGLRDTSSVVRWSEQKFGHCVLRGQFAGDREREWATGDKVKMEILEKPAATGYEAYVPVNFSSLETSGDLAPTTTDVLSFSVIGDSFDDQGSIKFRIPTHTEDGTVVSLIDKSFETAFKLDSSGHARTDLHFTKYGHGTIVAHLDFSCAN